MHFLHTEKSAACQGQREQLSFPFHKKALWWVVVALSLALGDIAIQRKEEGGCADRRVPTSTALSSGCIRPKRVTINRGERNWNKERLTENFLSLSELKLENYSS